MIPFQTTPEQALKAAEYAMKMKQEGIPSLFIGQALVLARVDQGAYELMELWAESDSSSNKDELIADLQELLDDHRELSGVKTAGPIPGGAIESVSTKIAQHKRKLRNLIDQRGGVTKAARLTGIPQPSLSRMLNSGSMPRKSTLHRIARGLEIDESEIVAEWAI
jgi:hypothetical protein